MKKLTFSHSYSSASNWHKIKQAIRADALGQQEIHHGERQRRQ